MQNQDPQMMRIIQQMQQESTETKEALRAVLEEKRKSEIDKRRRRDVVEANRQTTILKNQEKLIASLAGKATTDSSAIQKILDLTANTQQNSNATPERIDQLTQITQKLMEVQVKALKEENKERKKARLEKRKERLERLKGVSQKISGTVEKVTMADYSPTAAKRRFQDTVSGFLFGAARKTVIGVVLGVIGSLFLNETFKSETVNSLVDTNELKADVITGIKNANFDFIRAGLISFIPFLFSRVIGKALFVGSLIGDWIETKLDKMLPSLMDENLKNETWRILGYDLNAEWVKEWGTNMAGFAAAMWGPKLLGRAIMAVGGMIGVPALLGAALASVVIGGAWLLADWLKNRSDKVTQNAINEAEGALSQIDTLVAQGNFAEAEKLLTESRVRINNELARREVLTQDRIGQLESLANIMQLVVEANPSLAKAGVSPETGIPAMLISPVKNYEDAKTVFGRIVGAWRDSGESVETATDLALIDARKRNSNINEYADRLQEEFMNNADNITPYMPQPRPQPMPTIPEAKGTIRGDDEYFNNRANQFPNQNLYLNSLGRQSSSLDMISGKLDPLVARLDQFIDVFENSRMAATSIVYAPSTNVGGSSQNVDARTTISGVTGSTNPTFDIS